MFEVDDIALVEGVGEPIMTVKPHMGWAYADGYKVTLKDGTVVDVAHDDFAGGYHAVYDYCMAPYIAASRQAAAASVSAFEERMAQAAALGNITTQDGYIPE